MTLYVSDLDGTLLNSRAELSGVSRGLLQEMIDDGASFTVASARSVSSIRQMLVGLKLRLPVIEFNGAFISDLVSGKHELTHSIDSTIAAELYDLLAKRACTPFVSTFNGKEDCLYHPDPNNAGAQWYFQDRQSKTDPRLRAMADVKASLGEQVVCLTSIGKEEALAELADQIKAEYADTLELHLSENQYSPGWYWLTVHDHRATKDQAIQSLMQAYDLSEKSLVVFGDQINDLKMFSIADEAVAVENAISQVKERATQVIGHNDHDSVAKFMHEHRQRFKRAVL